MKATEDMIKFAQEMLNKHYGASLTVDGLYGNQTKLALLRVTAIGTDWQVNRQLIAMVQQGLILEGLEPGPVDGYYGPQTDSAFDQYTSGQTAPWRDDEGIGAATAGRWPVQTQDSLFDFYGNVGENQAKCHVPYTMKIAWNTKQRLTRFSCHKEVAEPMEEAFSKVLDHYGIDEIKRLGLDLFGGCLNVRKMRGGSKWSTHAWGIAIDIDTANNRLRDGCPVAKMCDPVYNKWFEIWEEHGATSLGRARNYDWQHIQFAMVK
jgi:hypothetical protein